MFSINNPYNQTFLSEHQYISDAASVNIVNESKKSFLKWRLKSVAERAKLIKNLIFAFNQNQDLLAKTCSLEMGKPIKEAVAEVKKCISLCEYYIEHSENYLKNEYKAVEGAEAYVRYEPLGVILGVMPWNFPYWQVFRFAIPAIMAGNTVVVKHASNVAGCAKFIEDMFREAGFEKGIYTNLLISGKQVKKVIENPDIAAVSLTGSEKAGAEVAATAAGLIKKSVLELGGSNAFIILEDANIDKAVSVAVKARFQNTGQSCIAAKRFVVHENVYEAFLEKFSAKVKQLKSGDPLNRDTDIGPLARIDLAEHIEKQVNDSVAMGAKVVTGGKRSDAFYEPTIITGITTDMPVFKEEVFGPVAPVMPFKTFDEAVELSNGTEFGLGVTIFIEDISGIQDKLHLFDEGAVFINAMVKSDPALPFGGVKKSGYGRELAENGLKEFVNVKTVFIQK
jgi:succinate-semialdehyde dehydrogenase / glutarate-semialdehyde dehydrogenase